MFDIWSFVVLILKKNNFGNVCNQNLNDKNLQENNSSTYFFIYCISCLFKNNNSQLQIFKRKMSLYIPVNEVLAALSGPIGLDSVGVLTSIEIHAHSVWAGAFKCCRTFTLLLFFLQQSIYKTKIVYTSLILIKYYVLKIFY